MLEKEIKLMLTEEEYHRLATEFDFSSEVCQVNHYFTCPECAKKRISVRVREVGGKALLQVKLPAGGGSGALMVREERERELSEVPDRLPAEVLDEICGIRAEAVRIGSLATLRKLCYEYEGVELALDKNEYLGITDYEAEAEYTGEYPAAVIDRIAALGIDTEKEAFGKYSRFCKRLEALRSGDL